MYKHRDIVDQALRYLDTDYIMIFVGARQSGKTTILRHLYTNLLRENKVAFFINLEDIDYLTVLNESPKNLFSIIGKEFNQKITVFIDEIQYLNNPTNFLKFFYDEYKNKIKLIVSGSSAFYIDIKFKDSLAGRKRIFHVYPLSFSELLVFKDRHNLWDKFKKKVKLGNFSLVDFNVIEQRELLIYFDEYLRFGGYPRVVLENDTEEKIEILKDLSDSFIKKDIIEAKINYPEKFFQLLRLLSSQIGNQLNKYELANTLGLSTSAIDNYLYLMLKSYHIALISPFHANLRKELTKQKKIYYYDIGLRNLFCRNFDIVDLRMDKGQLFENFVFRGLLEFVPLENIKFWRTQNRNEVDFIVDEKYAFEVKYNISTVLLSKYKLFLNSYNHIRFNFIYHSGEKKISNPKIKFFRF